MAELTVPRVDFSPLGELGKIYKEAQNERGLSDAFSQGIGSDPQSLTALAQRVAPYNPQMAISLAGLAHNYTRQASQDSLEQQRFDWQKQQADRDKLAEAADQRKAILKANGIKPDSPEGQSFILSGDWNAAWGKPIAYETLGGTKFLAPKPGGGYTVIDPNNMGGGAPVQSSPSVVGDAEGVARGLYDAPAAPGQRPPVQTAQAPRAPVQVADAQAPNFADRFGAAFPQAAPPAPQAAPAPPAPQPADVQAIDPQTGRREGYLKSLDPQVQNYIKKIADYEIDPRTTSVKGRLREQIMSAVATYDPTYDQNTFGSRAKAIKDFSTGRQGDIVRSFDVAIDHLDTLQKAANALQNGNYRTINEIRNRWREQTGSELPTDFKALVPIVSGEIAKAVVGSQNALADREELRAGLKAAASPEQLSGVISGYKALMGGQLKGLRKQYEETTGKKNFDSRVREATRKAILSEEGGGKADVTIDGYRIKEN